jgi:hypothetical protein
VHIGKKSQNTLELSHRVGKNVVDLLRFEDATWEHEYVMRVEYLQLFEEF